MGRIVPPRPTPVYKCGDCGSKTKYGLYNKPMSLYVNHGNNIFCSECDGHISNSNASELMVLYWHQLYNSIYITRNYKVVHPYIKKTYDVWVEDKQHKLKITKERERKNSRELLIYSGLH